MRILGTLIVGISLLACSGVADSPDPVPETASTGPQVGALARDHMDGAGCSLLLDGGTVFQESGDGIWMNINGKDVKLAFVGGGRPKDETWSAGPVIVTATSWKSTSSCDEGVEGCEGWVVKARFEVVSGEDATVFVAKGTCFA